MRTNRVITRPSSERVAVRLIVDRQTPVKALRPPLRSVKIMDFYSAGFYLHKNKERGIDKIFRFSCVLTHHK